jgi:hypothetical protein
MERRKAITTAAVASMTLLAGATAFSLNTGILGASGSGGPGRISSTSAESIPPDASVDGAGAPVPTASVGTSSDDHRDDRDHRDADHDSDDARDDDGWYDGAEDDD